MGPLARSNRVGGARVADLSAIRSGLAARLATLTSLRAAHATWPDQVTTPCAIVMPRSGNWRLALAGVPTFSFEVTLLVAPLQQRGLKRAQDELDAYLDDTGAGSVHAAIRGDVTLGGTVSTCDVTGFTDYGGLEVNGVEYLGVKIEVEVWA